MSNNAMGAEHHQYDDDPQSLAPLIPEFPEMIMSEENSVCFVAQNQSTEDVERVASNMASYERRCTDECPFAAICSKLIVTRWETPQGNMQPVLRLAIAKKGRFQPAGAPRSKTANVSRDPFTGRFVAKVGSRYLASLCLTAIVDTPTEAQDE